ncbi:MAG: gliding motility-associated C-terminal domain-containing protein, partial [Bacteroidia bacterium]|nr:gliding motility-associated C-terminal domain-containing protein [Bacteroidia bacterium]
SYTACSGQTITLQPTITPASQTGPQTYSWSNGPTASSIQVSTGGTFVFTVQGICGSAQATTQVQFTPLTTLQINAPPGPYCNQTTLTAVGNGTSFVWNGTTNASSIVVNQSGSYSVSSSVGCNTATASVNVTVNVSPTVQLSPLISLCSGQSAVLQPTITPVSQTGPQTYLWSNASTQNSISVNSGGIYGFTVNAPCGSAQATTQVNLTPLTTVQISAPNPPFCYQTTLTAIGNGTSYTWNGSVNAPSLLVTQSGSYTLSGFGPCNTATASLNVSITPILTLNVNPASTFVCKPYIPFSFTAQSNANTVWQNSINASVFTPTASGNYSVTASNACGQSTAVVTFSIYNVLASFTASPINGQAPLNVNLTNSSSGAVSYTWNFGNGQTSNATNPSVTFQMPGTYTLILIAGNDSCTDTAKIEIKVLDIFGPIPELVTPNDDGKNDYWEIKGILVHKNSEVEIYNRWGNLVYRKVPYKNEWNGQHDVGSGIKGRLPSGSYFYILKLNDADNRIFKGHVRLEY